MSYNGLGYYELKADPCICHQISDKGFTITGTYTDDVLGTSSRVEGAEMVKNELAGCYEIKDMGEATYILGIWIDHNKSTGVISLSQQIYLEQVLKHFRMDTCNPKNTPLLKWNTWCCLK